MRLDQPLAVADKIPQLADGRRRHEAAPQQPMLQQLRQPGRVTDIGLAAGEDLDVPGVDQQQLEAPPLKDIPDGLPVPAGGLHHHLGDLLAGQPVGQRLQPRSEGLKRPHLLGSAAAPIGVRTQATTSSLATPNPAQRATSSSTVDTSPARGWAPGRAYRVNDAETRAHSNSSWCREGPRVSLINGLSRTKESRAWPGTSDSHPSWRPQAMRVLSAITRLPLCNPAFLQVVRDRKGRSNAL
jgi:hypothetical protein